MFVHFYNFSIHFAIVVDFKVCKYTFIHPRATIIVKLSFCNSRKVNEFSATSSKLRMIHCRRHACISQNFKIFSNEIYSHVEKLADININYGA